MNNGAQLIGLPLQSGGSQEIFEAVAYVQSRNVLLVAAAGNDGAETPSYIASLSSQFSNVLSAGGLTSDGSKLPESNAVGRSGAVQIDAQGIAMSTVLGDGFATYRGTSVATGFVTGAAALALAANRGLSASQLRDALVSSVDLVGPLSDSRGTLDTQAAINTAAQSAAITMVHTGTQVAFHLTAADDEVRAVDGGIEINGIRYPIPVETRTVVIRGRGGNDRLQLMGTNSVDDASIGNNMASLRNAHRNWTATGFEFVNFDGGAGIDTVTIRGGTGNDVVSAKPDGVL